MRQHAEVDAEAEWPEARALQLERYLAAHWPALMAPIKRLGGKRPVIAVRPAWLSRHRRPWSGAGVYAAVLGHTKARFGFEITPHLLHDCAATSIAIEEPDNVAMVMAILGHCSLATSERHYIAANSMKAMRTYAAHIQGIRHQALRDPRRAGKAASPAPGRRGDPF